jgi:hypothetical protein
MNYQNIKTKLILHNESLRLTIRAIGALQHGVSPNSSFEPEPENSGPLYCLVRFEALPVACLSCSSALEDEGSALL